MDLMGQRASSEQMYIGKAGGPNQSLQEVKEVSCLLVVLEKLLVVNAENLQRLEALDRCINGVRPEDPCANNKDSSVGTDFKSRFCGLLEAMENLNRSTARTITNLEVF